MELTPSSYLDLVPARFVTRTSKTCLISGERKATKARRLPLTMSWQLRAISGAWVAYCTWCVRSSREKHNNNRTKRVRTLISQISTAQKTSQYVVIAKNWSNLSKVCCYVTITSALMQRRCLKWSKTGICRLKKASVSCLNSKWILQRNKWCLIHQ